jgi:hypothetical protein
MQAINALTLDEASTALAYLVTDEHADDVAEAIMFARGDLDRREPRPMIEAQDDAQPPYRTSGWQPVKAEVSEA